MASPFKDLNTPSIVDKAHSCYNIWSLKKFLVLAIDKAMSVDYTLVNGGV